MQHIFNRDNLIIEQGQPKTSITSERQIDLMGLAREPRMIQPQGSYIPSLVIIFMPREFYSSYASTIYLITPHRGIGVEQLQLDHFLVLGVRVDICMEAIQRVLFRLDYIASM